MTYIAAGPEHVVVRAHRDYFARQFAGMWREVFAEVGFTVTEFDNEYGDPSATVHIPTPVWEAVVGESYTAIRVDEQGILGYQLRECAEYARAHPPTPYVQAVLDTIEV
jgi:hypothetical protein